MKTILAWLFPTDHRRAAVGFLVATAAVALAGLVVTLAMRLTAHGFASASARAEWGSSDRHAVLLAHFVAVPLLPLVVGFAALPAATVRKRVVFPWLLALNLPLHAVACGWASAETLRRDFQYGDTVERLGPPFALLQLSLLLASVNLFGTALFRRSRADPDERLPLLVWSVGATAALTAATWVASFPAWQAAALGLDPMDHGYGWERWPHFDQLLSVCGGLLAGGVCLHMCLGNRVPGRGARLQETARKLGVASVWVLVAGYAFTILSLLARSGRWGKEDASGQAPGTILLAVTAVFALIAAVRRGQFRELPATLAAVVGLFLTVFGLATGFAAESEHVERLVEKLLGARFRGHEFASVPAHARAAAILFAFLAARLRGRGLGFGPTAVGVLVLTVGVSVGLGAEVGLALEGKAARWGRRTAADDPLGLAVSVGGLLSVLGLAVVMVGSIAERGKGTPNGEPGAPK